MGYVNISIAAVIVSTINKCLIYAHMSSTAETAWASLGHSNQDTNQHIWAYKSLPGENLHHCLKFPSGELRISHFAVEG